MKIPIIIIAYCGYVLGCSNEVVMVGDPVPFNNGPIEIETATDSLVILMGLQKYLYI